MIHKVAARRCRYKGVHKGCTSAGTDACVDGIVGVRMRHVIGRGEGPHSARHLVPVLVLEGKSNSRLLQGVKGERP
jgi:hypothetical protein